MRCRRQLIPTFVGAAAVALLAAGCGGDSSSAGVASLGVSSPTNSSNPSNPDGPQGQQDMVRFVDCMRSHGTPNLPSPNVAPRAFKNAMANESTALQSAYTACGHLQPNGGPPNETPTHTQAQTNALLAFAHCLRSHGFPNFPDPTSSGQLTHQMLASSGLVDLHQPALVHAADACTSVTHGLITKASVATFKPQDTKLGCLRVLPTVGGSIGL